MIFRRKRPIEVELTEQAYTRWLRAQRPALERFLALPADEQEALALLGDQYVVDQCLALVDALRNPAEYGARNGDAESEADLARAVAVEAALRARAGQTPPKPAGMAGASDRRAHAQQRRPSVDFLGVRGS